MQSHDKSRENIKDTINDIKTWNLNIDYLYFADSLGSMDNDTLIISHVPLRKIGMER